MKQLTTFQLCVLLGVLTLGGCANPYQKFYQPNPALVNATVPTEKFSGEPDVALGSNDPRQDILRMAEQGYAVLGSSNFVGTAQGRAGVVAEAKAIGAAKVLLYSKYRNTETGVVPLTLPTTSTSYSSGTVNAFGSGGFATGDYSGMTTTYGTQTTYIPYSVDKYEQHAIFFASVERAGLGISWAPLTDANRQALNSNMGVRVIVVRFGSPAFKADILPGDLLISLQGENVYDAASLKQAFNDAKGHDTDTVLFREGKRITKTVNIPVGDW